MLSTPLSRQTRLGLLLAGLFCFIVFAGLHPLAVPDEGRYPDIARLMLQHRQFILPELNGVPFLHKPILYYWMESASLAIFGITPWAARLPGALMGLAGCIMLFVATRRLFDERTALRATLILASAPLYFLSSQYADMNIQVAVLISASLLAWLVAEEGRTPHPGRWRLSSYAFAALGILSKGLIGLIFPMLVTGLWMLLLWRWSRLRQAALPTGLLLIGVVILPWFVLAEQASPGFLHYFFVVQHFQRFAATGFNNVMPAWFYPAVLFAGFMPWSPHLLRALFRTARPEARRDGRIVWLLCWLIGITVFFSLPASKIVGYIVPVVPAMALLTAWSLRADQGSGRQWAAGIGYALVAIGLQWVDTENAAQVSSLRWVGGITLVAALLPVITPRWLPADRHVRVALAGMVFNLALLTQLGPFIPFSQQALSRHLLPASQAPVVFYEDYYYDIPFYADLQTPVTVIADWDNPGLAHADNWRSEIYEGYVLKPESRAWLVTQQEGRKLLASLSPVQVMAEEGNCAQLVKEYPLVEVARVGSTCLLRRPAP